MELYIHIPFCVRKCRYCDFLSFASDACVREKYVDQLIREIESIPEEDAGQCPENAAPRLNLTGRTVETIFIGGGTPSLLPPSAVERILAAVRQVFRVEPDAEITMEANPGTLTPDSAAGYRNAGVSRLSLGLQSASEEELRLLGRIHTREQFLQSFRAARDAGFDNINVDLMSALPGQSEESWQETLRFVCDLEPEHISAYSLIVEEGTPLYEEYGEMCADLEKYGDYASMPKRLQTKYEGCKCLPDEETDRNMYHHTKTTLAKLGYERYEISNYARPGYACRHNIGYWTGVPYLGLGLGASSYLDGCRFTVNPDMKQYLEEKDERHNYKRAEIELDSSQQELLHILRRYQVKDPMIWLYQTQALLDKKEMIEIRHNLIIRRQSLRRRMDYNKEVIAGKAKAEVKDLVENYPKYAKEILGIVAEYDKDFT